MTGAEPALLHRGRWVAMACAGIVLAGTFGLSARAGADVSTPTLRTPADGSTSSNTQPSIAGTGEMGNTAIVTDKGVFVCAAVVAADKAWECVPTAPLASGPHTISVVQLDQASSLSASSQSVTFTIASGAGSGAPTRSSSAPSHTPSSGSSSAPTGGPPNLGGPTDPVLADVAPKANSSGATPLAIAAIIALALTFAMFAFIQLRPRRR